MKAALSTPKDVQNQMREKALRQRFPVEEWLSKTNKLYAMVVKASIENESDFLRGGSSMDLYSWNQLMFNSNPQIEIKEMEDLPRSWSGVSLSTLSKDQSRLSSADAIRRKNDKRFSLNDSKPFVMASNSVIGTEIDENTASISEIKSSTVKSPMDSSGFQRYSTSAVPRRRKSSVDSNTSSAQSSSAFLADIVAKKNSWTGKLTQEPKKSGDISAELIRQATPPPSLFSESPSAMSSVSSSAGSSIISKNLSFDSVAGFNDYGQDKPFEQFTDEDGKYCREFTDKIANIKASNSAKSLSIGKFLAKSESKYFSALQYQQLAKSEISSRTILEGASTTVMPTPQDSSLQRRIELFCQRRIKSWPIYSLALALGQLMAATSFQLVLLTGSISLSDTDFYSIGIAFLLGTAVWWILWRRKPSVYVLTIPFFMYSAALFLIALPMNVLVADQNTRAWVLRLPMWLYSFASASGTLYFVLNFGYVVFLIPVRKQAWRFNHGCFELLSSRGPINSGTLRSGSGEKDLGRPQRLLITVFLKPLGLRLLSTGPNLLYAR